MGCRGAKQRRRDPATLTAMPLAAVVLDPPLFVDVLVTILVIMDPLGNVPVFLPLTRDPDRDSRRSAALQATAVAGSVILVFASFGQGILRVLGISLPSLPSAPSPRRDRGASLSPAQAVNSRR